MFRRMWISGVMILCVMIAVQQVHTQTRERLDSGYEPGYYIKQNLCDNARITTLKRSENIDYSALIDKDYSTGLSAIDITQSENVELHLYGRPPWMNKIIMYHSGPLPVSVQVYDVYGKPTDITLNIETVPYDSDIQMTTVSFTDMRVSAIRLKPDKTLNPLQLTPDDVLFEIESFYEKYDADNGKAGRAAGEVGVEYVQYYKNKPCSANNITKTKKDAVDFQKKLNKYLGWTKQFRWGNADAYESDFTTNNQIWVDVVDFMFFSGHGNNGRVVFSHQNNDCYVENTECQGLWGNGDLEWIYFSSCRTLRRVSNNSVWNTWHGCFDGLHLILGWHTNMRDVNLGKHFAKYAGKKKRRILKAFKDAARRSHSAGWWKNSRQIVVLAEVKDNFNDHLHGAGYVSNDYVNNGFYWAYTYSFSGLKSEEDNDIEITIDKENASSIQVVNGSEPVIIVPNQYLQKAQIDPIPQYVVSHRQVDSQYVAAIADAFCANYGIFCTYQFFYDTAEAEYSLIDGPHELDVSELTGAWEYSNTATDAVPTATPPNLPSPSVAAGLADIFWNTVSSLPNDAQLGDLPIYARVSKVETATGSEVPDSSWNVSISASHIRVLDGYPIVGPGASLEVVYGDNNEIQTTYFGGWRDVTQTGQIIPITLQDALESVAASGPEVAIGSLPLCDTFIVDTAQLGYYEPNGDTLINELQPIWVVDGWCLTQNVTGGFDTSLYQMWIPADFIAPHGMIDQPGQDTLIQPGDSVVLAGSATSGTPPYQFNWFSDIDDSLGSGQVISVPMLSDSGKGGGPVVHTIILEVIDANGGKDYASVDIQVSCCVNRGNVDGIISPGGAVDVADLTYLVDFLFQGGPPPPCEEEGNVDSISGAGGAIDVSDLTYLVAFLFQGGSPPLPC